MKKLITLCLSLFFCLAYTQTYAFYCQDHLIKPGISKARLQHYCGKPESVAVTTIKTVSFNDGNQKVFTLTGDQTLPAFAKDEVKTITTQHKEKWTYNFGSTKLMKIVTIVDDNITDIANGDYGY